MLSTQSPQVLETQMRHVLLAAQMARVLETRLRKVLLLETQVPGMFVPKMFRTLLLLLCRSVFSMAMVRRRTVSREE